MLPRPHLVQKFAVDRVSTPQFEQNIFELNAAMLDLFPETLASKGSVQDRRPRTTYFYRKVFGAWVCRDGFVFAVSFLFLPWGFFFLPSTFWFCRELFGFAVRVLVLLWAFWFCRVVFVFAVSLLFLPWRFWICREVCSFAVGFLVLPWAFWFCRELFGFAVRVFGFAVRVLVLPWGFWFCRELFGFAVKYFLLPWQLWATVVVDLFGVDKNKNKKYWERVKITYRLTETYIFS